VSPAGEVAETSRGPFVAAPNAGGGSGCHADSMLGVRYGSHEGYERVVLDLGTGDQPAQTVPRWTLSSPNGGGLLRVNLPSASATGVSSGGFGDRLLASFHVVRAPEGGKFVDFFARSAFLYRVLEVGDPARLVVDFKPAAPAGGRRDRARGAAQGAPDLRPPRRQRLLPQLRGHEYHNPNRRDGRGCCPQDRPRKRLEFHLRVLRGHPRPAPVLGQGDPEERDRERPRAPARAPSRGSRSP
jgi:hypothetical protein